MLLLSLLFFFQVLPKNESFASSHESFADFFFRLRLSLIFFTVRALCSQFSQVAPVVDLYFRLRTSLTLSPGRARRWFFPRLRMSRIFFGSHEFSSQIADIAGFSNLCGSLIFCASSSSHESVADFFFRLRPSLTFFTCRGHRWLLFQVAPFADFFLGSAHRWFSHVAPVTDFPPACAYPWFFFQSHESDPDFFFRLRSSLLFSQVAHVADFSSGYTRRWFIFPGRTISSLTPFQIVPVDDCFFTGRASRKICFMLLLSLLFFFQALPKNESFASSHESFADFFFRLRPSLIFFTVRARCSQFSQVAPVVDLYFRLRTSLTLSPGHSRRWFSPGYARRWFFFVVARFRRWLLFQIVPVADYFFTGRDSRKLFFMLLLSLLSFSKLCLSMISLPVSARPSPSSFSGCARRWLSSQVAPVAEFYFRLRTSLTFSQVAPVADFSAV